MSAASDGTSGDTQDGILVVDKPAGWTSHDVVARCRRLCRTRKVGHAGTLDPMATGVLVLGVGRATRLLTFLVGCDKDYTATIRLGQSTLTDDAEGEITGCRDAGQVTGAGLSRAVERLTGSIEQVPSSVSAIKIKGERAYHRVRAGQDVELAARPVTVSRFEVLATRNVLLADPAGPGLPERSVEEVDGAGVISAGGGLTVLDVDIAVTVSSGTYVRALARDLGLALGVGGHLTVLRRTRVGGFELERSSTLAALTAREPGPMPTIPLAEAAAASLPVRHLTLEQAGRVSRGQPVTSSGSVSGPRAAFAPDGSLVAILVDDGVRVRSRVVFPPAASQGTGEGS